MATVALVGCAGQVPGSASGNGLPSLLGGSANGAPGAASGPVIGKTGGNVALLLPLTGNLAPVGLQPFDHPRGNAPELTPAFPCGTEHLGANQ